MYYPHNLAFVYYNFATTEERPSIIEYAYQFHGLVTNIQNPNLVFQPQDQLLTYYNIAENKWEIYIPAGTWRGIQTRLTEDVGTGGVLPDVRDRINIVELPPPIYNPFKVPTNVQYSRRQQFLDSITTYEGYVQVNKGVIYQGI